MVAHECAHIRQGVIAYKGDIDTLVADMNRVYGGSGYSGIDQNADCVTVLHGLGGQHYTLSCSGDRRTAAQDTIAGRRVTV